MAVQISPYQQAVVKAVKETSDNLIVSAVAGAGKTTLLSLVAEALSTEPLSVLYLAFNNEICNDVEPKISKYGVTVRTFHKWGNAAIRNGLKINKVNKWKYKNYIEATIDSSESEESLFYPLNAEQIRRIVDIIRLWFVAITPENVLKAFNHCELDLEDEWYEVNLENFVACLQEWIKKGLADKKEIDFVDMLMFPVAHKLPLQSFNVILIDESQDLSPLMQVMIKNAVKKGTRIISVGDRKQAINGFAGADMESFDKLKELTNATEYPLSICYRCPDVVIELAKKYVPEIEGTGKEGTINHCKYADFLDKVKGGELAICRVNAPLLKICFALMLQCKNVIMKGGKFTEYLKYYVKKVKRANSDFDCFLSTLDEIVHKQIEKTKNEDRIQMLADLMECFEVLIEETDCDSFTSLTKTIDKVFDETDKSNAITLSSFHGSKGLQNENVYILNAKPLTPPSESQESNLAYVALTRTLKNLTFVDISKLNR